MAQQPHERIKWSELQADARTIAHQKWLDLSSESYRAWARFGEEAEARYMATTTAFLEGIFKDAFRGHIDFVA